VVQTKGLYNSPYKTTDYQLAAERAMQTPGLPLYLDPFTDFKIPTFVDMRDPTKVKHWNVAFEWIHIPDQVMAIDGEIHDNCHWFHYRYTKNKKHGYVRCWSIVT
jgi:hypothetical protein